MSPWSPDFEIAAEVAQARTPPPSFYRSTAAYEAVRERVFATGWQWLCHAGELPAPGEARPFTLLPGLLDEPVLLVRDPGGALHALSNVCTHRGRVLVEAPLRLDAGVPGPIRCPYHGRRFACDGRMHFMPGFEGVAGFPAAGDHLPRLALHQWAGQVFVALPGATAGPPEALLRHIEARLAGAYPVPLEAFTPDPSRDRDFSFDAHWALYVDNYLEGLHIPFVHPGLTATLDWQRYRYERWDDATLQIGLAADDEPAFAPPPGTPEHGQRVAAWYWWLFPNLMLNFYPWGLSLNLVLPLAPGRTRVLFRGFVAEASAAGQPQRGAGGALDAVEAEDQAAILGVQRGLAARLAGRGRYSAQHEAGTHHFHLLLLQRLGAGTRQA